ncbi:DUF3826 domain-containing protein [Hymenobacter cellulosivorans]|uniref:DUF3826 domain-containing protein n=1 Tax=Hymenobacter cellulosivorans TaxID=2932249 RepID=A0ABY4F592_9BACT|nr:DUF3826 domain-containing protein [Hymenobacter cellulosivorans]UOQ51089.1 DUF3826 domain-containing protein [Hymenobacter cellulosivorans]
MSYTFSRLLLASFLATTAAVEVSAQTTPTETKEAAYTRTVNERAGKIVEKLGPLSPAAAQQVQSIIADQYQQLNQVHERQKAELSPLKAQPKTEATAAAIKQVEERTNQDLAKLHTKYLRKLNQKLSPAQVEQVKDGMTYGVLPITMRAYQDMLPNLTPEQKAQMLAWLTEAREKAMDAGSSEQKHAWFGKYKGKINNYLSAAGIDMNQAGKDWQARLAARKAAEAAQ